MRSLGVVGSRCDRCQLPHRWCICAARRAIDVPIQVDLLMHARERHRPSSTGNLIHRLLRGSRLHVWRAEVPADLGEVSRTRPECWVIHPQGAPLPANPALGELQVVLLDGSWLESSSMSRAAGALGRRISLPMTGESRYWLRDQQEGGRFSTAEALMFLLDALGLEQAGAALRLQFELHVYANLRARGQKARAEKFLEASPVKTEFADILEGLNTRRPREA